MPVDVEMMASAKKHLTVFLSLFLFFLIPPHTGDARGRVRGLCVRRRSDAGLAHGDGKKMKEEKEDEKKKERRGTGEGISARGAVVDLLRGSSSTLAHFLELNQRTGGRPRRLPARPFVEESCRSSSSSRSRQEGRR